jgi:hypothetical protein
MRILSNNQPKRFITCKHRIVPDIPVMKNSDQFQIHKSPILSCFEQQLPRLHLAFPNEGPQLAITVVGVVGLGGTDVVVLVVTTDLQRPN